MEVVKLSDTIYEIILKPRRKIISLRLNYDTILAYDKLALSLNLKNSSSNIKVTRTALMTIILERVIQRPDLLSEILYTKNNYSNKRDQ